MSAGRTLLLMWDRLMTGWEVNIDVTLTCLVRSQPWMLSEIPQILKFVGCMRADDTGLLLLLLWHCGYLIHHPSWDLFMAKSLPLIRNWFSVEFSFNVQSTSNVSHCKLVKYDKVMTRLYEVYRRVIMSALIYVFASCLIVVRVFEHHLSLFVMWQLE